jgi:manganese/zinc/iron transport system permease protein
MGEALSHAAYPGVVLSAFVASLFFSIDSEKTAFTTLALAFLTAFLGLFTILKLESKVRMKPDSALCFVIASFFGVGVLLASRLQLSHALFYKTVQLFLYGQAATMRGIHVQIYGFFTLAICLFFTFFFHPIRALLFDPHYPTHEKIPSSWIRASLLFLLTLSIIIGIRSVGVVLISGMLIAPAIAASGLFHKLHKIFISAALIGALSGFLGNYLSVELPFLVSSSPSFSLPTGPMILLSSGTICVLVLLFGKRSGLIRRYWRIFQFRKQCLEENILKFLWKASAPFSAIQASQGLCSWKLRYLLFTLKQQGWIQGNNTIHLTSDGKIRAGKIVRLHRLWEVYLVSLGAGAEKVHASAEEMEHIISPELEKQLSIVLGDPHKDPHAQPIPPEGGLL